MHLECFAPYDLPHNVTKRPSYYFVVQPHNDLETVVKVVLMHVQSRGVLNIPSHVPSSNPTTFGVRVTWTSKSVTYDLQF